MTLVPAALRELFIDAVTAASDMYLRDRFARAGIPTDEVRVRSPNPACDGYIETRPVRHRVERYFAHIDWCDRRSIARVLPIVEEALGKLQWHPGSVRADVDRELELLGLEFRDGRIRRRP